MKTYAEQPVPATTRKVLVKIQCDMCKRSREWKGSKLPGEFGCAIDGKWIGDLPAFRGLEVSIGLTDNSSLYPEGGVVHEIKAEICPDCFKDHLVPWLRSRGVTVDEVETDV